MKERPILFSTPMIKAILEGRKTMTRRLLKQQPLDIMPMNAPNEWVTLDTKEPTPHGKIIKCRFGVPGDCLWVRETFHIDEGDNIPFYKASEEHYEIFKWKPSIFMPRWASRIILEITNIRIERLQDITEDDAIQEGIEKSDNEGLQSWPWLGAEHPIKGTPKVFASARQAFESLWDSINGKKYPWESNPYVWRIEFKRVNK